MLGIFIGFALALHLFYHFYWDAKEFTYLDTKKIQVDKAPPKMAGGEALKGGAALGALRVGAIALPKFHPLHALVHGLYLC